MNVARPACNIAPSFTADHCRSCLCIGPLSYWGKPSLPNLSLDVPCFISSTIMNVARPACNIAPSFTADHCRSCQCIGPLSYWGRPSLPNLSLDVPCFISSTIMNVARPARNIAPSFTADHCRSCQCIGPLSYWGRPPLPNLSLDVPCFTSTIMNVARPACNIAPSYTADHCRSCQCIGPLSYWGRPPLPNLSLDVPCFISSTIMNVARPACNIAPSFTADHCRSCQCIGPLSYWGRPPLPNLSLDVPCFISSTIMNVARPACNIAPSFTADHCRSALDHSAIGVGLLSLILAWMFPALYLVL